MSLPMRPLLLACLATLALAAPAAAQDPQVDPGSPAGTEYRLPIDSVRAQAGRGSGTSGSSQDGGAVGTGEAPLFGAGVEEKKAAGAKPGTDSDPATVTDVEPDLATSTPATVRAQAPAPDGGGGGLAAIAGGAAGVLLLGGLAGLVWRRRSVRG